MGESAGGWPWQGQGGGNLPTEKKLQGLSKRRAPGLVIVPAVAYHFCLSLPATFTQPGASLLSGLCKMTAAAAITPFTP